MSATDRQMLRFQPCVPSSPLLTSLPPYASPDIFFLFLLPHQNRDMSLTPLMFRSMVRLVTSLVGQPAASISTLLYYSDLLPQNIALERLVQHQLLDRENYLFHFLINFLRCFW